MATVQPEKTLITVEIRRHYIRAIREDAAQNQMVEITRAVGNGWKLELQPINDAGHWFVEMNNKYPTDIAFLFLLTGPANADELSRNNAISAIASKLSSIKTGTAESQYRIHLVDGLEWKPMKWSERVAQQAAKQDGMVTYADVSMPDDWRAYFQDIYDADAQVNMVVRKMRRVIEADFEYRDHCLLVGPPGAAKSFTLMLAAKMFPAEAVLKIDGTAMTSAGIIELLKEIPVMPRFIFVEEIDKANNDAVAVLLGIMDKHGEIRKTVFKNNVQRECRACVFATANNGEKIAKMQEGALASRFGNAVTYTRPNEAGLRRILHRELNGYGIQMCLKPIITKRSDGTEVSTECGKCKPCKTRNQWIDITLEWCKDHRKEMATDTLDPRFVIQMCVTGQDELVSGEYQRDLEKTSVKKGDNIVDFGV